MDLATKPTWRPSVPPFASPECAVCQGTGWQLVSTSGIPLARRCTCRDLTRLIRLKDCVGIPPRYERCSIAGFCPRNLSQIRALEEAQKFVERYPSVGRGLLFVGPAGTGKTHLAVAILRALSSRIQEDLLFVDFTSILPPQNVMLLDEDLRQRSERCLRQVSLLVLDNFGLGAPSPEILRSFERILEARLQRRRLTVLTGESLRCRELFQGQTPAGASQTQNFLSALPPQLLMRLLSNVKVVTVNGEDYRRSSSPLFG